MFLLKVLFLVVILISQLYVLKFHSSIEGKDERGKEIQYKTNQALFTILYAGMIALIVLHLVEIVPTMLLPDLLLYFMVVLSVFGGAFTFIYRRRKNY